MTLPASPPDHRPAPRKGGPSPRDFSPEEQLRAVTDAPERGVVPHAELHVATELRERFEKSHRTGEPLVIKAGFDPSSPDLHLGHLVLLRRMKAFQDLGHTVVFVIGDFTAMIGDPTGKSITRPPLTREQVAVNARTYSEQVYKVLDRERTVLVPNSTWLDRLGTEGMIRLLARYPLARMMEREDFKTRYAEGRTIALHELAYPLVQAYDSVALRADVELGSSDQLFNLVVARDIMKEYGLAPEVVLTGPLLEGLDAREENGKIIGAKMSKSLGNAVGVNDPPNDAFGKLMSIPDAVMWRYYALLSLRPRDEQAALRRDVESSKAHPKDAKVALAKEIVGGLHGAAAADAAAEAFERVFTRREVPEDMPAHTFAAASLATTSLPTLLVQIGLCETNSDVRRLIGQGGLQINGQRWTDAQAKLAPGTYVIKAGKRRFARLIIEP